MTASHPYLRAYMAGALLPTWVMLGILAAYILTREAGWLEIPIERAVIYPMAVVPNLWGVWNTLYHAWKWKRIPLGVFGALLPMLLVPGGVTLAHYLDIGFLTPRLALLLLPMGMAVYYVAWKHIVGYFNRAVGLE